MHDLLYGQAINQVKRNYHRPRLNKSQLIEAANLRLNAENNKNKLNNLISSIGRQTEGEHHISGKV